MPDATHKTLPPGYTRNADGSVMGPQGGRYSAVGTDLNGQRVYRDGGGRYYTLDGGTKVQVSNPASSPNVSITQQQAHHQGYVDDITGQLEGKGYSTTSGGFFSKCGSTVCYPDIIYSRPGSTRVDGVIEIKTGGAGLVRQVSPRFIHKSGPETPFLHLDLCRTGTKAILIAY